jgi:two-component system sensor histidine kinase RegB
MLEEAAAPYRSGEVAISIAARPASETTGPPSKEAVVERRPGVIYGLGNIIENATDFARSRVDIEAEWNSSLLNVTITDDGPGFRPEVIDSIGEPYVTTRPGSGVVHGKPVDDETTGLGLGFFIAKTLLERSGATVSLANRGGSASGAIVQVSWPRSFLLA